ncbi:dTDP-4-dehydrorhamnose reductase [Clostridium sp. DSM 8431]|uniref:dTDP-4-dehydrorhamnose reductase n=1 Tax=Clostridium sp. DSM 8431 TaxID=1761781 RepID=UPI0008E38F24|nr:dTDP-4-dehydrorhamnose reductase [Clostridium sp. DSM 8431]SFU37732.1 dTDP-4-dehydrorhamnose reductase [Clostridium sp. DSM 8431]
MKILITGGNGQLGNELKSILTTGTAEIGKSPVDISKVEAIYTDADELDITNLQEVKEVVSKEKPDVIINCAAFTNVDGCESNQDAAFKVNALGPRNLAIAAEMIGAKLVHVSTDYVFPGVGTVSLKEFDATNPVSTYGTTKLLGEEYVREFSTKYYIVRTAWLYGYVGKNFVYTMMRLAKANDKITVVNDQRGNPTNANDLAYHILKLINTEEYGVYHCTANGECSWYDFASKIVAMSGEDCTVEPCTSEEYASMYPNSAKRPEYSSLDNMMLRCTVGDEMRNWQDAIETFMNKVVNK